MKEFNENNIDIVNVNNHLQIKMMAKPENEKLARNVVASFLLDLNPSVEEISDIKTVISEAVTNCIVHGYNKGDGDITIDMTLVGKTLILKVIDQGVGIKDIKKAMQPFFTTRPEEERSGMGFTVMETFMDSVEVTAVEPHGTCVTMVKEIKSAESGVWVNFSYFR